MTSFKSILFNLLKVAVMMLASKLFCFEFNVLFLYILTFLMTIYLSHFFICECKQPLSNITILSWNEEVLCSLWILSFFDMLFLVVSKTNLNSYHNLDIFLFFSKLINPNPYLWKCLISNIDYFLSFLKIPKVVNNKIVGGLFYKKNY